MMSRLILSFLIALTGVGILSAQSENSAKSAKQQVLIQSTTSNGEEVKTNVEVLSGSADEVKMLLDSLMNLRDSSCLHSQVRIIEIPGDGFEMLEFFGQAELEEFGRIFDAGDHIKWIDMEEVKDLSAMKMMKDKPFLGVIVDTDILLPEGLKIMNVVGNSAAEEAGLGKDDILIALAGKETNSLEDLVEALSLCAIDQAVDVKYSRNGVTHSTVAVLKSRAESNYDMTATFDFQIPDCCKGTVPCEHQQKHKVTAIMHQPKPVLGVLVEPLDAEMIEDLKVKDGKGVLVTKVMENSPGKTLGLKVNDVLLAIDGRKVENLVGLHNLLADLEYGQPMAVEVLRYGVVKVLHGNLEEMPAPPSWRRMELFED